MGVLRLESLNFIASSLTSNPDIGFFYAISPDGVTWGSYADNPALLASTVTLSNPQGYQALVLPNTLGPFVRFAVSGTGSNPSDCVVTVDLVFRMAQ